MRVERLEGDKVRFHLTMDDLLDRGIEKDDMWSDVPKVHDLFNDMMEHAYQELGFEVLGPLSVEVFALPAQGVIVVVSRSRSKKQDELSGSEMYELEVTMEENDHIVFRFLDVEHLIQVAIRMNPILSEAGRVYSFQNRYYLVLDEEEAEDKLESLIALLLEYGEPSTMTDVYLSEYGNPIWKHNAIEEIARIFG
ncbi:genetic competence negative regulator [Risungbinella massiliensis]|uniref:genetic competence negative regulator n=1 Tax=Risungbinella massiliensis TaxID=1329796 RepID=UPI0005CC0A75|nr:genetic competence negative regulator [Risungbinella massiliensis]